MSEQINLELIHEFSHKYNENVCNKIIENSIVQNGLANACKVQDIVVENQPVFSIELPESKRYNQKDSNKCGIFAGLNVIKYNIANNLNLDVNNLELSNSFISFFDKLEKSNNLYETIIELDNIDLDYLNSEHFLDYAMSEAVYWQWFVSIINKYGLVPYSYMPDSVESSNYARITDILNEKVKKDVLTLLNLKQCNESVENLRKKKLEFLAQNYNILSKILGEPMLNFDLEYKDKNNEYKIFPNMTPLDFRNKFLTLGVSDFVSIGNVPMYNKQYNKLYSKKYLGNIYKNSVVSFLNLPIEDLKELVIQQLKDNTPVWMACYISKFRDKKLGIFDTRLFDYASTLGVTPLSKEDALNLHNIETQHAMTFCGVHLSGNKPVRWKVEDSYGDSDRLKGYYVMNDNFFDEYVFNVIIDKKYLTDEQLDLLNQSSIDFGDDEPF